MFWSYFIILRRKFDKYIIAYFYAGINDFIVLYDSTENLFILFYFLISYGHLPLW